MASKGEKAQQYCQCGLQAIWINIRQKAGTDPGDWGDSQLHSSQEEGQGGEQQGTATLEALWDGA
jgi:hypothetical protein